MIEAIYLGFRTTRGINLNVFESMFGLDFYKTFQETIALFEKDGLLEVTKSYCRLTPKGLVLLDGITAEFTSQDLK